MCCINVFEKTRCRTHMMRLHDDLPENFHIQLWIRSSPQDTQTYDGRRWKTGQARSKVACANRRTPLATPAVTALNSRQVLACHQDFCTETVTNVQNLVRFGTSQDVILHDNLDSSLYPGPIMPDCTAHLSESLPRVDWYGSVWLRRPMMRTEWTTTALLGISATRESSTRTEALSLMSTGCPGQSGANDMSRCLNLLKAGWGWKIWSANFHLWEDEKRPASALSCEAQSTCISFSLGDDPELSFFRMYCLVLLSSFVLSFLRMKIMVFALWLNLKICLWLDPPDLVSFFTSCICMPYRTYTS